MKHFLLAFKVFFTANVCICFYMLLHSRPDLDLRPAILSLGASFIFSLPALALLWMLFWSLQKAALAMAPSWVALLFFVFVIAIFPYYLLRYYVNENFFSDDLMIVLRLSEGSAFLSVLLQCGPIHRFIKSFQHEDKPEPAVH